MDTIFSKPKTNQEFVDRTYFIIFLIVLLLGLIIVLLSGCMLDNENIPLCKDINKTGTNCMTMIEISYEKVGFNSSNAVCKYYENYSTYFCFDTEEETPEPVTSYS